MFKMLPQAKFRMKKANNTFTFQMVAKKTQSLIQSKIDPPKKYQKNPRCILASKTTPKQKLSLKTQKAITPSKDQAV